MRERDDYKTTTMITQLVRRASLARPLRALSQRATPLMARSLSTDSEEDATPVRPTLSEVQLLPRHVSEYSPELLISCALHGDPDAIRERLTREVMRVDGVEWREANAIVDEIHHWNDSASGCSSSLQGRDRHRLRQRGVPAPYLT